MVRYQKVTDIVSSWGRNESIYFKPGRKDLLYINRRVYDCCHVLFWGYSVREGKGI